MKSIQLAAVALAFFGTALSASAQTYVGGDVGTTSLDGFGDETSYGLYIGHEFNTFMAGEVAYRKIGRFDTPTTSVRLNMAQVSAVGSLPITDTFKLFGRIGYGFVNVSGTSSYDADHGFIYGAGLQFNVTNNVGIRAEYTRLASDADQVNLGVNYKF